MTRRTILAAIALLTSFSVPSFGQSYASYDSLTYAVIGGKPLRLHLRIPSGASAAAPVPCVLWIHGGAWEGGNAWPIPGQPLRLVTEKRIAIASVEYRLTSESYLYGGEPVTFPAQIHDIKGAVRWLRAHAGQYGLDVTRFGAWGPSAGGHLSALLGTSGGVAALEGNVGGNLEQSSRIQAWADYYGPTDLLNISLLVTEPPGSVFDHDSPDSPESALIGWNGPGEGIVDIRANIDNPESPYPELVALCRAANPITHIDSRDPPAFIAHGTEDTTVPRGASDILDIALDEANVLNDYRVVYGAGHGPLNKATDTAAINFLESQLARPQSPGIGVWPSLYAWPNPSRDSVTFGGGALVGGQPMDIFDVAGRRIATVTLSPDGNGRWDGINDRGNLVASGFYWARVKGRDLRVYTARFTILR
ncbi:MAG TPA: alpha/beta hydrolase fold domain-containing protein [Candidatus Krumholzibacteria bacterium]|nr:alpha/beta hydrolase fold domain-containing protein [Candidatus Krumholzibacteria bacterium]